MQQRRVPRGTSLLTVGTGVALAVVIAADGLHACASRRGHGLAAIPDAMAAGCVVVLGFANGHSRINMINRWRARIALRSARGRPGTTIICSGGAVRGSMAEAELLRRHLRDDLGWSGRLVVETESRSTWENVRNVAPLLADAQWIVFASNSLHAEKARRYLRRQRPDLARRLVPGPDHRWGEMAAVKPVFAAVGVWKLARLRRST
ncbi:YdcF family protein [Curtobacterium sp. NPDC089689]|uniref:YdcF family protein n=1 Tax=Curtobacterium sp. NPDC089689 TaxID=3363968 RepID=UPI0037F294A1